MRRLIPVLALLTLAALLVWAFLPRPVEVETAFVERLPLVVTVEEEGEARIREVFTVSATLAGRLQRINLHAGDSVTEGKTVVAAIGPAAPALLDSRARSVAEAATAAAQAALELAQADLARAEATRDFRQTEADRATALYQRQAISQSRFDTAMLELRTAVAAVDSARANLTMRERELDSALAVLRSGEAAAASNCCVELVAPVTGRILRVLTESEQDVQTGTPILEIGDPGNLEVVVELLSRDAVRMAEGAAATITGWGGPPIPALVERVEPSAETRISALGIDEQRVKTILALDGPPEAWRGLGHGFRVIAEIEVWRDEAALGVPVGALFRDGGDWAAYVVRDGRAQLMRISLGERNADSAQVLDGLTEGDQVIVHPSDQVADGVAVAPIIAEGSRYPWAQDSF